MVMTWIRRYSELIQLPTFEDRFDYLKLNGDVGRATFGFDRYINQKFYLSREWQDVRRHVIIRDNGCDLGMEGYEISVKPLIHHINPMGVDDILHGEDWILDPEYLITTSHGTHNAIHFGAEVKHPRIVTQRSRNDTKLW
jgi:hypothetical protein